MLPHMVALSVLTGRVLVYNSTLTSQTLDECNCTLSMQYPTVNVSVYECTGDSSCVSGNGYLSEDDKQIIVDDGGLNIQNTQGHSTPNAIDMLDGRIDDAFDSRNRSGGGAHVYVMDSGVACSHQEFQSARSCDGIFTFFNEQGDVNGSLAIDHCSELNVPEGTRSHGIHVASTAVGLSVGVAPDVHIHSVRVLGCNGGGRFEGVVGGIAAVIDHHRHFNVTHAVVVASLGARRSAFLDSMWSLLFDNGIPVIAAAGNSRSPTAGTSPAAARGVYTVGALMPFVQDASAELALFSNFGTYTDNYAVGVDVRGASLASNTSYVTLSGTSMAAPVVAGVALLLLEDLPSHSDPIVLYEQLSCISPTTLVLFGRDHMTDAFLPVIQFLPHSFLYSSGCLSHFDREAVYLDGATVRAAWNEGGCCGDSASCTVRLLTNGRFNYERPV